MYESEQIGIYPSNTCLAIMSLKLWITDYSEDISFETINDEHVKTVFMLFNINLY